MKCILVSLLMVGFNCFGADRHEYDLEDGFVGDSRGLLITKEFTRKEESLLGSSLEVRYSFVATKYLGTGSIRSSLNIGVDGRGGDSSSIGIIGMNEGRVKALFDMLNAKINIFHHEASYRKALERFKDEKES